MRLGAFAVQPRKVKSDIAVGYSQATIAYMTHAIKGISENDSICAAKIDALFEL